MRYSSRLIASIIPIGLRQMFQAHWEFWSGEPEIALLKLLCDPGQSQPGYRGEPWDLHLLAGAVFRFRDR